MFSQQQQKIRDGNAHGKGASWRTFFSFGEDEHEKGPWDGGRVRLEPPVVDATSQGAAPGEACGGCPKPPPFSGTSPESPQQQPRAHPESSTCVSGSKLSAQGAAGEIGRFGEKQSAPG